MATFKGRHLKVQALEPQVLDIEISEVQVLEVHVSDIQISKVCFLDIQVLELHVLVLQEANAIHVLDDQITNVNETMKAPKDLNTNKEKLKQSGRAILIGFELDSKDSCFK
jgi:hypothetical protein